MANRKNLANGELAAAVTSSATTATLKSGQGSRMPATPFFVTVTPKGEMSTVDNSEVWNVTAVTTDALTIQRGQKGTTAKAFAVDAIVANGVYTEDLDEKANVSHTHSTTDLTATGGTTTSFLRKDNTWATPTDTTYSAITTTEIDAGSSTTARTITGVTSKYIKDTTKAVYAQTTAPTDTNKIWYDTAATAEAGINADTVDGFHASNTPAANTILSLDTLGKIPLSVLTVGATGVQTLANTGTGGGTMSYINLGGLKILFGQTTTFTVAASSDSAYFGVNFPSGFFSATPTITPSIIGNDAAWSTQLTSVVAIKSSTAVTLRVHNYGTGTSGSVAIDYWIIGV